MVKRKGRTTSQVRHRFNKTRIVIYCVIISASLCVIIATIISFIFTPEYSVKTKLDKMAHDYYSDRIYSSLANSEQFRQADNLDDIMKHYHERGFAMVPVRMLLLYDNQKYANYAPLIQKYCDIEKTYVKFYPDPPYGNKDYHFNFNYSCNFD